jgi:large repetitive protein
VTGVHNNLLENGSFEFDGTLENGSWGVVTVPGWTNAVGGVEVWPTDNNNTSPAVEPTDGESLIELDANTNAGDAVDSISQTVNTVADQSYELSFDFSARPGTALETNSLEVYWDGELLDTIDPTDFTWQTATYTVQDKTGDGTATLTFQEIDAQDDSYGILLDNAYLVVV